MKKLVVLFLVCLSCIFYSCDYISMSYFSVVNNSTDTIGYSVYLHERSDMNNSDVYFLMSGNSVAPRDTVKPYIEYMGKGYSWRDCFDYLGVDTAYVCISKKVKEADWEKHKLPNKEDVLKIFRISEEDFDMTQNHVSIIYP